MTEKIHALQPMLDALRIKQAVSFDDCSALFQEVANKTGMLPPPFELSGNQWCALVNLAIARFATPPAAQPAPVQCWKCGDMDAKFQAKCTVPACGMKEST